MAMVAIMDMFVNFTRICRTITTFKSLSTRSFALATGLRQVRKKTIRSMSGIPPLTSPRARASPSPNPPGASWCAPAASAHPLPTDMHVPCCLRSQTQPAARSQASCGLEARLNAPWRLAAGSTMREKRVAANL